MALVFLSGVPAEGEREMLPSPRSSWTGKKSPDELLHHDPEGKRGGDGDLRLRISNGRNPRLGFLLAA